MLFRLVFGNLQANLLCRQAAHGGKNLIAADDAVMLRLHQRELACDDIGLSIQDVEGGALPDLVLFDHAIERKLGCGHNAPLRHNRGSRGIQF